MKIIQVISVFSKGDAVCNNAITIKKLLTSLGYDSEIYVENEDYDITNASIDLKYISVLPELDISDIIIYHLSTCVLSKDKLVDMKCRKVGIYHNVTPPEFFAECSFPLYMVCKRAVDEIKSLADTFDYCIADSTFNRDNLIQLGYKCPIDVIPILLNYDDFKKESNKSILSNYNDGKTNIIFVGRVVPNKKQDDLISIFSCYKKNYDSSARLFIIGSSDAYTERYKKQLEELVKHNNVDDVIFTEKIPFDELLAYYHLADVFLCMSEHEGFCVPLVETMMFDIPIVAYNSSAIEETLGGSGILISKKEPLVIAGIINRLMNDQKLRAKVIHGQRQRLEELSYDKLSKKLGNCLRSLIEK